MYIELALGGLCLTALRWSCLDVTFYSLVEAAAKYIRNVFEKQSHCVPQLMQQHKRSSRGDARTHSGQAVRCLF